MQFEKQLCVRLKLEQSDEQRFWVALKTLVGCWVNGLQLLDYFGGKTLCYD